MLSDLFEYTQNQLLHSTTLCEIDHIYTQVLLDIGAERFAYTHYTQEFCQQKKILHSLCGNAVQGWHDHFVQHQYESIDPVGKRVANSTTPVIWNLKGELVQAKGRARNLFNEALDYGLNKGISIPIHGVRGCSAILVIHQEERVDALELQHQCLVYLHHITLYYYQRIIDLSCEMEQDEFNLTTRERECLLLTAANNKPIEIAEKLNITKRTVNFHLENANNKLGTRNKHQSVAKAIYLRLLDL